jgi:hypothetical protein
VTPESVSTGPMAQDIAAALGRIEERYRIRFAGHPRVSRDPDELEKLISELDAIPTSGEPAELTQRLAAARELYSKELAGIREAQAVPFAVAAHRLRTWSDLSMSRYQRNFAGQDRRTRDLGLLEEIIDDLHAIRQAMRAVHNEAAGPKLDEAITNVERVLELYTKEREAIRTARRTGSLSEQGSRLAELANRQFARYTMLFAGQSRLSRHTRTLERILTALEEIRRGMQSLKLAGFNNRNNDQNITLVDERLRAFRQELVNIQQAQQGRPLGERISGLATAANEIFSGYREQFAGKSRDQADQDLINRLFERLWPIAREMDKIDDAGQASEADEETNTRNLRIVTDNLVLYAREFDAIRQARNAKQPPAP